MPQAHKPRVDRVNQRRDRIVAEIQRNRRGENAIPTWVLAAVLVLIVVGFTALVVFT
ncbi:MAG TPA: hypothetical protein VGJ28_20485 [Micromonosporaceae bacterium]|jgi:hypothetical protein